MYIHSTLLGPLGLFHSSVRTFPAAWVPKLYWRSYHLLRAFSLADHPNVKRNIWRIFNGIKVKFSEQLTFLWFLKLKQYKNVFHTNHMFIFSYTKIFDLQARGIRLVNDTRLCLIQFLRKFRSSVERNFAICQHWSSPLLKKFYAIKTSRLGL
jgi:hypothetical protein